MIAQSISTCQTPQWRHELATAFTSVPDLIQALDLPASIVSEIDYDANQFKLLVPRRFVALMKKGDPTDPLLLQVLPLKIEQNEIAGYIKDPVNDLAAHCGHGVLRKYSGRALLLINHACAIHCRYCFRRHFKPIKPNQKLALDLLINDRSITEIILSGGDPLLLNDRKLMQWIDNLAAIPHIKRLRIHSRVPIILPSRITNKLCKCLINSRLLIILIIQANHPQELDHTVELKLKLLRQAGITILNQSVLLNKINNNQDILIKLSERLFECGVLPYYLHQLDPVQGAAQFQVNDHEAYALIEKVRAALPGYLTPRLVKEISGASAKQNLCNHVGFATFEAGF